MVLHFFPRKKNSRETFLGQFLLGHIFWTGRTRGGQKLVGDKVDSNWPTNEQKDEKKRILISDPKRFFWKKISYLLEADVAATLRNSNFHCWKGLFDKFRLRQPYRFHAILFQQLSYWPIVIFWLPLLGFCEGTTEGEAFHSLLNWL